MFLSFFGQKTNKRKNTVTAHVESNLNKKKGISDKYVHRVLEWYVLGVIDLSRGETPSGDATVGRNDRNSVKMRNAYKQGS